ncbi:MAG: HigA family addiction module antitoxin [Saccharofermentanales bacterium]|jgi:HTH-type transcriptional regulator/antitoxin HigA
MSNYVQFKNKIAFHPGYYIEEIIKEKGITQEDFAKRLDTTPKNISKLINGHQNLSVDMSTKLSRLLGTSIEYWLNLQTSYDAVLGDIASEKELIEEREVFKELNYKYFRTHFNLPDLPRKIDQQIESLRNLLKISSLTVLKKKDLAINFRSMTENIKESNLIKANTMVQLAINITSNTDAPKFNKNKFEEAVNFALTLTEDHKSFYKKIKEAFLHTGVVFVILPNISGSCVNGATKKIDNKIMLMVNDRRRYSDTFWFTLFHEIGHIINGDFGISMDKESGEQENEANKYAQNKLIPETEYSDFLKNNEFTAYSVQEFSQKINRDPGIIVGRLQHDGLVTHDNIELNSLKTKYRVNVL